MYLVYSFLLSILAIALLPYFLYQALLHKKYLNNFRERLGYLSSSLKADSRPTVWLHAVSLGETLAALPLVNALRERFPGHRIVFSTTTATGQAVARARVNAADGFFYFPFDWRFSVRNALRVIQPRCVVLMESELWPNFLQECRNLGVNVLVSNGRVSERSFKRARQFRFWFKRMTSNVTRFLMQTEVDAGRIIALGARPETVEVAGNLKYDIGSSGVSDALIEQGREIADYFNLAGSQLLVVGSTTDGEDEMVLRAFEEVRKHEGLSHLRMVLAPRHPQRFDAVARKLESFRCSYARRSSLAAQPVIAGRAAVASANPSSLQPDVVLLDSIGELAAIYQFATVVLVGGSLIPKGGHNILEPALEGKPIIVGPYTDNFREIVTEFRNRDALIQLPTGRDIDLIASLRDALVQLLLNEPRARQLGENARLAVLANRGATRRTVAAIAELT